jgi:hypothetical protein
MTQLRVEAEPAASGKTIQSSLEALWVQASAFVGTERACSGVSPVQSRNDR